MPKGYPKAKELATKEMNEANKKKALLAKFSSSIGERDEFIDLNVRGEKARKVGEIAAVVKLLGTSQSFQISIHDFEKAYGMGKKGRNYVKGYLKKFGIPNPRVEPSSDKVHIWFRGKVAQ